MGQLAVPMMIGAAVGGGSSLLRGKGLGGILQGAALGGAGGALTGGASNLFNTGSLLGASSVGSQIAKDAAGNALASTVPGTTGVSAFTDAASSIPFGTQIASSMANPLTSGPTALESFYAKAKEYATPQNLLGVAQLATENNQAPLQRIGGGDISRGQMPQYVPFNVGEVQTFKKRGLA